MDRGSPTPLQTPDEPQALPAGASGASRIPLPSEQLLQGRRVVEIAHNGEVYRLQATRLGKLILTK
jgi:hemin uptake protein HemP